MLSTQFRELTSYLQGFNESQLEALRGVCCAADEVQRHRLLCDLVTRFVREEHGRRYRKPGKPQTPDFLVIGAQGPEAVHGAAQAAQRLADVARASGRLPLTAVEALPIAVFLEQLAVRLFDSARPDAAGT